MLSTETLVGLQSPAALEYLLTSYADRYPAGRARAKKLVLLTEKAMGELRKQIGKRASAEVRNTIDAPLYRRLCEVFEDPTAAVWLERVERENRVKKAQLDQNLTKARSEATRELIRLALKDLGIFFQESGDSSSALKTFYQGKDAAMNTNHNLEMALLVMEAGLDFGRFDYVSPFAVKAEQYLPPQPQPTPQSWKAPQEMLKVRVALGLSDLERKRYKSAAKRLLSVNPELKFSHIISNEDVATIAVLCALATYSRTELLEALVQNASFRPMLELVPTIKNFAQDFIHSRYASLMQTLQQSLPVLQLDPFLWSHAESLVHAIKEQAMLQCVAPYSCIKLEKMARAFELDEKTLENELTSLVSKGLIQARIDAHNRTLHARGDDDRDVAIESALSTAQDFVNESCAALLRISLLENLVVYAPVKKKSKGKVPSSMLDSAGGDGYEYDSEDESMDVI